MSLMVWLTVSLEGR